MPAAFLTVIVRPVVETARAKVAVTLVPAATLVAPAAGDFVETLGASVSAVVNDQVLGRAHRHARRGSSADAVAV